jgi:chromosome segregation ATPase
MTNRETDGDIHGERAAEIHRLVGELRTQFENFERAWQMRGDGIDHLQSQIDACRPYLKEGETAADALNRMQKEVTTLRNAAMQLWADRRTFDKGNDMNLGDLFDKRDKQAEEDRKDAARYRWLRMNRLWLKGNLPMLHVGEFDAAIDKARAAHEVAG